jgi:hypothetical protein
MDNESKALVVVKQNHLTSTELTFILTLLDIGIEFDIFHLLSLGLEIAQENFDSTLGT